MKRRIVLSVASLLSLIPREAVAQVSYTGAAYIQKFNTLQGAPNNTSGVAWTNNVTVPGWYSSHTDYGVTDATMGGSAAAFDATTVGANVGLFAWGVVGAADRAIGSRASPGVEGNLNVYFGVRLVNDTAQTITAFSVMFTGEQWFKSSSTNPHMLGVEYQIGAASITSGTWTPAGAIFTSPIAAGSTATALNGNDPANRRGVAARVAGVSWTPGAELWIRFSDGEEAGREHGLGIDDFVFTTEADSGLFFDGADAYVTAGAAPSLGAQTFTVECWFFRTGAGTSVSTGEGGVAAVPLIAKGRGEADGGNVDCAYFLGIDAAGRLVGDFEAYPAAGVTAGQNYPARGGTVLPFNQWTHVAATYSGAATDGQKWKLYVNGAKETNTEPNPPAGAIPRYDSVQHFSIGSALNSAGAAAGFFQGVIDEARVWNAARSGTEVLGGMNQQISAGVNLIARFGFGEGTGATAANSVAGFPGGTLAGPPVWLHGRAFPQNTPPSVFVTAPVNGYSAVAPAVVNIAAAASDPDGSIAKIEFFSGATKIGEDATAPFELAWARSNEQTGTFGITAVATDNFGASAASAAVSVTIVPNPNLGPAIAITSPGDGATGFGSSVNLTVAVSDPENDPLAVTFRGRVTAPAPGPDFTLIAIPDTQYYTEGPPSWAQTVTQAQLIGMFGVQTQWIVEQRAARNIAFVSHMGDLVNNYDWNVVEWQRASAAMSNVENPATTFRGHGIPWGVAPGNHDIGVNGQALYFNQYFGSSRWAGRPYYGGHYGASNDNNYELFSASGLDFVVIHLTYDTTPDQAVLDWAESVLQAHPNRRGIVTSHYIISSGSPNYGSGSAFSPQGQANYDNLKDNPNLFLMLCGHVHGEGRRSDVFEGRTVHSVLQDYQNALNGGNGFLRIFTFSPANNTITVKSWSPFLNRALVPGDYVPNFNSGPFTLPYDMQGAVTDWIELGTVNVAGGALTASFNFAGLEMGKTYEWYASASDGISVVNSGAQRFSTVGNGAPLVALVSPLNGSSIIAGTPVTLAATADDGDGGIARVEFFAGGVRLGEDTTAPYTCAWTPNPGYFALTAVATDDAGADAASSPVNATVSAPGNVPPTVAVASPANGASVGVPATVTINATASDPDGSIAKVEFYNGAAKLGEANSAPFSFTWPNVAAGSYTLTAVAIDDGLGAAASAPVGITVLNASGALPYTENFDSMGAAGTALPMGWSFFGALGGSNGTWTNGTGIPAGDIGGGTMNNTLTATTTFTTSSNTAGYNYALPASPADRAIGTSPTSGQGLVWQLALMNNTGSAITALRVGYDIRRLTAPASANELPGYRLFYSVDSGATWTSASDFNPALASGDVQVPNTTGVTTVPPTTISLAGPWPDGAQILFRWVDDNAGETSPDQIIGLDNVFVDLPIGQLPTVGISSPANGPAFILGDTINLAATASDTGGTIAKVEFFANGTELGEDLTDPFEYSWTGFAVGNHSVTARATDNDGNTVWAAPISVIVNPTAGDGTLTRGPYLNQANQNSIVIRWRSSHFFAGRVRYGTSSAMLDQFTDEPGAATTEHAVTLTGLAPFTRYYYSVGSATFTLAGGDAEHTFRTSPVPGTATDTRIWVLGDAGRANANQAAVRDAYYTWTGSRTPDLCLMLGDNAYNSGTQLEYQAAVFDMYSAVLRKMPLWSCVGNHDTNGSTSGTANFPYFDMFTFPTAGECGGLPTYTERYYSFDYGNIHFVVLDSQTSSRAVDNPGTPANEDGPMAAWLRLDLAATTKTWIIALFHHPPYSKGSHNSDTETQLIEMRERFGPILETGGVDLVLTGHSHCYERSFFIDGHYLDSTTFTAAHIQQPGNGRPASDGAYIKPLTGPRDRFGAVYTVTGSAGSADGGALNHPAMYVSHNTLGSFNLDILGNQLTATYIESDGDLADTFTMIKQGAADSDGDGVADAFEMLYGMDRFSNADATIDPDFDGNIALAEYLFGLNPSVPDRYGWSTSRNPATGFMEVSFPTLPQRTYRVFWSDDLLAWSPASSEVSGDGSTMMWIDDGTVTGSVPSAAAMRFYRVQAGNGP